MCKRKNNRKKRKGKKEERKNLWKIKFHKSISREVLKTYNFDLRHASCVIRWKNDVAVRIFGCKLCLFTMTVQSQVIIRKGAVFVSYCFRHLWASAGSKCEVIYISWVFVLLYFSVSLQTINMIIGTTWPKAGLKQR